MRKIIGICAGALLVAACTQQDGTQTGANPNNDTGMAEQNTAVNAGPDTGVGAGATASSGIGTASARGAAVNETQAQAEPTNNPAKPQHPPDR